MFQRKRICQLICAAVFVGGLTGCASSAPAVPDTVMSAGDGTLAATDTGIYELQTVFPDSVNLFYTDVETKERIFLCANPNCSHNDETCTSYIANPSAMFPPMLLRTEDQLLVFFTEPTDASGPHAMTMDFDGSNRKDVFELSANQQPLGGFYIAGNRLWFDLMETDETGSNTYQLWCADLQKCHAEKEMDLGTDAEHFTLCGCTDEELCFRRVSEEGSSYCMYSLQEHAMQDPFYVDSSVSGNSFVSDGYLFALDEASQAVIRTNLATNEQATCRFLMKEGYGAPDMRYLFDGNLLLTETQNESTDGHYDICAYVLNFQTGDCAEMTLRTAYNDRPVVVLSEVGDLCYVAVDYKDDSAAENVPAAESGSVTNVYAFIAKQDYLNSNSSGYQRINDCMG